MMKRWSVSGFSGVSWLSTAIRFPEGPRVSCPAIQHPRTPTHAGHKISCWSSYWDPKPQWARDRRPVDPSTRSPRCDSSYWVTRKWRRRCCLASCVHGSAGIRTDPWHKGCSSTDSMAFYSYHPNSALDHDIPWRFARFCEWLYNRLKFDEYHLISINSIPLDVISTNIVGLCWEFSINTTRINLSTVDTLSKFCWSSNQFCWW